MSHIIPQKSDHPRKTEKKKKKKVHGKKGQAFLQGRSKFTMDQRLNLGNDVRELKLGSTFNTPKPRTSFHTLKYDFKPASIDLSKTATLDVSSNNQVTVTMPHLDSSGVPKTVFKGNQRNYTKECVLIIDKVTGEITLEKLHHNIQVKKTRSETNSRSIGNFVPQQQPPLQQQHQPQQLSQPQHQLQHQQHQHLKELPQSTSISSTSVIIGGVSGVNSGSVSGASGVNSGNGTANHMNNSANNSASNVRLGYLENSTQRVSNKTRVSTGVRKSTPTLIQRHSPLQGSPSYPQHHKSPQQAPAWNANNGQSTLPSIPMIGMDDDFVIGNSAFGSSHSAPIQSLPSLPSLPMLPTNSELPSLSSFPMASKPSTSANKSIANNQMRHTNHSANNHTQNSSNMQNSSPFSKHNQAASHLNHQTHMEQRYVWECGEPVTAKVFVTVFNIMVDISFTADSWRIQMK